MERTRGDKEEGAANKLACLERHAEGVGGLVSFVVGPELKLGLPCAAHVSSAVPMAERAVSKGHQGRGVRKLVEALGREYA